MAYSKASAAKIALSIYNDFGALIRHARLNEPGGLATSESFLAGFIGVEAARDKTQKLIPERTRFESGVFADLVSLRDRGFCYVGKRKLKTYSGVSQSQIKGASDAAIRALSTSYNLTQIMGYHVINNLSTKTEKVTIADLRDTRKHLFYSIRLLQIVAADDLKNKDYASVLRIWNTGRYNGKTHDPDYVKNASMVTLEYNRLLMQNATPPPGRFPITAVTPETARTADNAGNGAAENTDDLFDILGFDPHTDGGELTGDNTENGAGGSRFDDFGELTDFAVNIGDNAENTAGEIKDTIETTGDEIKDQIDGGGAGGGIFGKVIETAKETFPAIIPKRSAKDWLLWLVPGGGIVSTVWATVAAANPLILIAFGIISGIAIYKIFDYFKQTKLKQLNVIESFYASLSDPAKNNLIPVADTPANRELLLKLLENAAKNPDGVK